MYNLMSNIIDGAPILLNYLMEKHYAIFTLAFLVIGLGIMAFSQVAHATPLQSAVQGTGKYVNEKAGVEIQFPEGWKWSQSSTKDGLVTTAYNDGETARDSEVHALLSLSIINKNSFEEPPFFQPPLQLASEINCEISQEPIALKIAGVAGAYINYSCNGDEFIMESTVVSSNSNWIIFTVFSEEELYEEYVGEAGSSALKTLKVSGAIDIEREEESVGPVSITPSIIEVTVSGEAIQIQLNSSSVITDFRLHEVDRLLSFKTVGESGTDGITEISIGRIIKGTYLVTIDGQITDQWMVDSTSTGETILTISYANGTHEISIQGTQVVPEFNFLSSAIVLSMALGTSVFLRRLTSDHFISD